MMTIFKPDNDDVIDDSILVCHCPNAPSVQTNTTTLSGFPSQKRYNNKVPVDFYDQCLTSTYFQQDNNWKLISPCWTLVEVIYRTKIIRDSSYIPYVMIEPFFHNYDNPVTEIITAMFEVVIFKNIDMSYSHIPNNKQFSYCRQYFLSDNIMNMCEQSDKEYLIKLHNNRDFKRQESKNRAKRIKNITSEDIVCAYNTECIKNLMYSYDDLQEAQKECEEDTHKLRQLHSSAKRLYNDISCEYHEVDGRIHNSFVGLPKILRKRLTMKDGKTILINRGDIDYRAMHPTFFAHYVMTHLSKVEDKLQLIDEYDMWNDFWNNTDEHPRSLLMEEHGFDSNDQVQKDKFKTMLLSVLNDDDRRYELLLRTWIKDNFPCMFKVWFVDNHKSVKHTGTNISKYYEKELLRSSDFYEYAETLPVKIMDCHDGVSIFTANETDFEEVSALLMDFQTKLCKKLFGITPVITNK